MFVCACIAILKAALWYKEHLQASTSSIHIVLVSEDPSIVEEANNLGIKGQRLGQYLQNYYPDHMDLYELYDSIAAVAALDEAAAEAGVPTDYEEVRLQI
jgi:hypothetical protein